MKKIDVLFLNVPAVDTDSPFQAPAVLKAQVQEHGFTASTYDFNLTHRKLEQTNEKLFYSLRNFFTIGSGAADDYQNAKKFINECVDYIFQNYQPSYIGISVFTYTCQKATEMLATMIKQKDPAIKIFIGGQGLGTMGIEANKSFAENLKNNKVIDDFISSEGEITVVELLKKNYNHIGINTNEWEQSRDLSKFALPDYSDYLLDQYKTKRIMITGSRGCVRRCTFCDIHKHWKTFVYREGKDICKEIITQYEKHNITDFTFTDSLVNGSMKAYRDFVNTLAKYNASKSLEKKIRWGGQLIIRGLSQMTKEDWTMTRLSGANNLSIGVESGSERVRDHMQKKFTNQEMDEFVEQAFINNVSLTFLILVGYPTETEEEFQETMRMFEKYKQYSSVITNIQLGTTLGMLPGTSLVEHFKDEIEFNNGENFWLYAKNPTLDFKKRIQRRILLGEHCLKLGYSVSKNMDNIKFLHFLWNVYKDKQRQGMIDTFTSDVSSQKYS